MEVFAWIVGLFGCGCLILGAAIGYQWGHKNGYKKGCEVGIGSCEAQHLGSLGDK